MLLGNFRPKIQQCFNCCNVIFTVILMIDVLIFNSAVYLICFLQIVQILMDYSYNQIQALLFLPSRYYNILV